MDMTDRILFRIAVTVYIAVFMAQLQTSCVIQRQTQLIILILSQIRQQRPAWLSHQSNRLRTADDILVDPAQPFGTACRIISDTLLYRWTFIGAIWTQLFARYRY